VLFLSNSTIEEMGQVNLVNGAK